MRDLFEIFNLMDDLFGNVFFENNHKKRVKVENKIKEESEEISKIINEILTEIEKIKNKKDTQDIQDTQNTKNSQVDLKEEYRMDFTIFLNCVIEQFLNLCEIDYKLVKQAIRMYNNSDDEKEKERLKTVIFNSMTAAIFTPRVFLNEDALNFFEIKIIRSKFKRLLNKFKKEYEDEIYEESFKLYAQILDKIFLKEEFDESIIQLLKESTKFSFHWITKFIRIMFEAMPYKEKIKFYNFENGCEKLAKAFYEGFSAFASNIAETYHTDDSKNIENSKTNEIEVTNQEVLCSTEIFEAIYDKNINKIYIKSKIPLVIEIGDFEKEFPKSIFIEGDIDV